MPGGRKRKEVKKASGELDFQDMLMYVTNSYISKATDEQRRLIYEYTVKTLSEPAKTDEIEKPTTNEPEKPADEGKT